MRRWSRLGLAAGHDREGVSGVDAILKCQTDKGNRFARIFRVGRSDLGEGKLSVRAFVGCLPAVL
jgi:hypothetical protein